MFVRVDRCALFPVLIHELLKRGRVRSLNHGCFDGVRLTVLHAHDGSFPNRPTPCFQLLAVMLVLLFPADIRLVRFHRPGHLGRFIVPHFPDTVGQVPRGLLRDVQVSMKFHAADAFQVGAVEIKRQRPLAQR